MTRASFVVNVSRPAVACPPLPAPVAEFTGSPPTGDAPLTVAFRDASTSFQDTWHWEKSDDGGATWADFDGTPAARHPAEVFAEGTWDVRLTVTNDSGADAKTRTGYVVASPP